MGLIDALCDIVPAVKPQSAYYENLGWRGMEMLERTIRYAKSKGCSSSPTSSGETSVPPPLPTRKAGCPVKIGRRPSRPLTPTASLNGYMGSDSINLPEGSSGGQVCLRAGQDLQSRPGELQDMVAGDRLVYQVMGDLNQRIAKGPRQVRLYHGWGRHRATYPSDIRALRKRLEHTFFLVPGYGAQGDCGGRTVCLDKYGHGAIVNSSRGIMCAWQKTGGTAGILPRRPGMRPSPCGTTSGASSPCNSSRKRAGLGKEEGLWQSGPVCSAERWRKLVPVLHHPVWHQSDPVREVHAAIPGCGGEEKIALRRDGPVLT